MSQQPLIDLSTPCTEIVLNWSSTVMAICHETNLIRLFKKSKKDGSWQETQQIVTDSSPKRLKWAHSDFGNAFVIKTTDNRVIVYKEKNETQFDDEFESKKYSKWEPIFEKAMQEEDTIVQEVKFAPPHFGSLV